MDRAYLQNFKDQQLEQYATTLQRRIKDLKELTLELTGQNKELGETYEDLIHQKSFIYHQNEKKKKSWSNWFSKGKQKIGNLLHISKPSDSAQKGQSESEPKPEQPSENQAEQQLNAVDENTPKKKVLTLLEMGKEKISKLFHSGKSQEEPQHQEGAEQIRYEGPQNRFHFLSQLVKENTNHHESKFSQFIQRTQEGGLKRQSSGKQKKQPVKGVTKESEKKSEIASFQQITQQVEGSKEIAQNSAIQVQTTAFQSIQMQQPEILKEPLASKQQVEEKILKLQQSEEKDNAKQQQTQELQVNSKVVQENEPEENEYAIQYDEPEANYELQEGAVSQIVEKQLPSQDQLESPSKNGQTEGKPVEEGKEESEK